MVSGLKESLEGYAKEISNSRGLAKDWLSFFAGSAPEEAGTVLSQVKDSSFQFRTR